MARVISKTQVSELGPSWPSCYNILNGVLSRHAPIMHKRIESDHLPQWFNDEIKQAVYELDRFHKLKDRENYKQMRNKISHLIVKSKKNYYNTAIQKGTNAKDLWKIFRKINITIMTIRK